MNNLLSEQKQAIKEFYKSIELLKEKNVIRSKVIFGDIGEFLSTIVFPNLELVEERTQEGYDALDGNKKVQIKFSDSSDAKNIDLGKPHLYDYLIVVLKKESAHIYKKDMRLDHDYYFYIFNQNDLETLKTPLGEYKLSKTKHKRKAIKSLNL